ncbi:MAG: hypothetical protein HY897_00275 [Deltaproteobacteria bacterium]|nr:hypothetical protein [Deltaproteobacteria bacterium]
MSTAESRALSVLLLMAPDGRKLVALMADESQRVVVTGIIEKASAQGGRARAAALLDLTSSVLKEDM